jgi:4-alpha-glucanotransferase
LGSPTTRSKGGKTIAPCFIRFGREIIGDLAQAERREWWLANGLGAYAAGTVAGTLTRRYHGLLIAPLRPPLGRFLVFAKADAWLEIDGKSLPLCSNRWPQGVVDPQGHIHVESFWLDGRMPVWRFAFGDLRLEQRIWLEPEANTVYVAFRPDLPPGERRRLKLRVKLLVNARDHHGDTEPGRFDPVVDPEPSGVTVRGWVSCDPGVPYALRIKVQGGRFEFDRVWIENFDLPVERERGLSDRDHHLSIGEAQLLLLPGEWVGIAATLEKETPPPLEESMRRFLALETAFIARARARHPPFADAPPWVQQLILAAASFLFTRALPDGSRGESVIAGFPWFGDFGRDTMIALPGLTLATGRYDSARRILMTFASFVDRGLLPNQFPGSGETPDYNSADAALWYFEAWRAYLEVTGDLVALRQVFPVLEDIVRWHVQGSRYGIVMDQADGLLKAGEEGVQLTWMDAKVGDWVVTPRRGKPVEINALWFNALKSMAQFARCLGVSAEVYDALAETVRRGFQRFVNPATGTLFDVLDGPQGDDDCLRPNQILAVSLPFSPLDAAAQRVIVRVCGERLLTSYGLRSLAPEHPNYCPCYRGGVRERDGAYHQGTVWAWLLGHYALAEYRVTGDRQTALSRLEPIRDHLFDAGLGMVSEIFDADPPHLPRGCPAQAWSVACVLEAWWKLSKMGSGFFRSHKR